MFQLLRKIVHCNNNISNERFLYRAILTEMFYYAIFTESLNWKSKFS